MRQWSFVVITLIVFITTLFWIQSYIHRDTPTIIIGLAGDTMLGRSVNENILNLEYRERTRYVWGDIIPFIRDTNFMMVNLETTLTTSTDRVEKVFNFKADPDLAFILNYAGIDLVNLANNHSLDFGASGLKETINALDSMNILHVGAGSNIHKAQHPVILLKQGVKIGIMGFTDNEPGWKATESQPGVNYIKVGDTSIAPLLESLREKVDIMIISLHWGPNMRERPTQEYIDYAHFLIDNGADIIHGHSAHIVQGIELYKSKVILYDTGDFVDDYAVDPVLRNDLSFLFLITADKNGPRKIQLIPTAIKAMQVNQAQGNDYDFIVTRMRSLCAEMGTTLNQNNTIAVR